MKTLSKDNAERVARHLAMAANEIDDNPALAHEHAQAAVRHAGRVAVARETLAITAYAMGDFSLALRELRTLRRISGNNEHIAMIVDSERGVGRPEKALEEGNAADRDALETAQRVQLAIAMSGARLDLGQTELALAELDIAELDPNVAFSWSPGLFAARAAVLEDLGLALEAEEWQHRADVAAEAIAQEMARDDELIVEEIPEVEPVDEPSDDDVRADEDHGAGGTGSDAHGGGASETVGESTAGEPSAEQTAGEVPAHEHPAEELPVEEGTAEEVTDADAPDPVVAVEDEVAEILVEAGVDEPEAVVDEAAAGGSPAEHGQEVADVAAELERGAAGEPTQHQQGAADEPTAEHQRGAADESPAGRERSSAGEPATERERETAGEAARRDEGEDRPDGALF